MSSTIPPASGMPWPQLHVPAPRGMTAMRWRAAAAATAMTSALVLGMITSSANLSLASALRIGLK